MIMMELYFRGNVCVSVLNLNGFDSLNDPLSATTTYEGDIDGADGLSLCLCSVIKVWREAEGLLLLSDAVSITSPW